MVGLLAGALRQPRTAVRRQAREIKPVRAELADQERALVQPDEPYAGQIVATLELPAGNYALAAYLFAYVAASGMEVSCYFKGEGVTQGGWGVTTINTLTGWQPVTFGAVAQLETDGTAQLWCDRSNTSTEPTLRGIHLTATRAAAVHIVNMP